MTLKVIVPASITAAEITSKSIATETAYAGASVYTIGDIALASDGNIYEFIGPDGSAGNHADPVTTGQTDWVDLGPPNYLRPFDTQVGVDQERVIETLATDTGSITYTIDGLGAIFGFAFMNVTAVTILVEATDAVQGDIFSETYTLQDAANVDGSFFRWLSLPINRERRYARTDLFWPAGVTIDITISNPGETVSVGAIVMGLVQDIGSTSVGAKLTSRSRSFISFDGYKNSIVRRFPSSGVDLDVMIPRSNASAIRRVIEDLDGVAAVYVAAEDRPDLLVYGVHTSAQITGEANDYSFLAISVESI